MPLGTEVGLVPGNFVLDGDRPTPHSKEGGTAPPQFSAHIYCGQTAGWIKMPLGTELSLGPGDTVLDGDPAHIPRPLTKRGTAHPQFSVHVSCGQTAGWIKPPLGMVVGLGSGDIVLDGEPTSPLKGAQPSPIFSPCLLWSTVAHLSYC